MWQQTKLGTSVGTPVGLFVGTGVGISVGMGVGSKVPKSVGLHILSAISKTLACVKSRYSYEDTSNMFVDGLSVKVLYLM